MQTNQVIIINIFDFLIEHWKVLFQGIGVAIFLLIVSFLIYLYKRKKNQEIAVHIANIGDLKKTSGGDTSKSNNINKNGIMEITPKEIINAIDETPLLTQDEIAKNYCGIHVVWEGTLSFFYKDIGGEDDVKIFVSYEDMLTLSISAIVSLNKYPILKTLKGGHNLTIEGTILKVKSHTIELADAKLTFDKPYSTT